MLNLAGHIRERDLIKLHKNTKYYVYDKKVNRLFAIIGHDEEQMVHYYELQWKRDFDRNILKYITDVFIIKSGTFCGADIFVAIETWDFSQFEITCEFDRAVSYIQRALKKEKVEMKILTA